MEKTKPRFIESFGCALRGLKYVLSHEKNFQIELVIATFVVALMFLFNVKIWETIVIILMIMWILITELINTVFERVVDILKPRVHPYVRLVKDIMAAVVLISCVVSIIVGVLIFFPYFQELLAG